jgi:hypothetical protein
MVSTSFDVYGVSFVIRALGGSLAKGYHEDTTKTAVGLK